MRDLAGKVAVITGGASGIGLAFAKRFGTAGMRLLIADVEADALNGAARELADAGMDVHAVQVDVSVEGQVDALAEETYRHFGTAHVICNNAGVGAGGVTWELPVEVWEWVLGVDLWGVVYGIRAFLPRLLKQDDGHMVNTASVGGLVGGPGMAPYEAAKHAVVGLSQSLEHDLRLARANVHVTVVCPALTRTRMNESGRNWPERLGRPPETGLEPGHPQLRRQFLESMSGDNVLAPEIVAEKVYDAVIDGRFWVITEDHPERRLIPHYEGMLTGNLP